MLHHKGPKGHEEGVEIHWHSWLSFAFFVPFVVTAVVAFRRKILPRYS
jgi:hypothetical protein